MASFIAEPVKLVGEERFLLRNVRWDFYRTFCNEMDERPIRLSYDRGNLEITVIKSPHEFFKKMLAKLIEMIVFERRIPVRSGGSMTFQREDLEKGFEPDECWWIQNEALVRGKREFDFLIDPAPDLAIEVEITNSLVNRIGIYAAIGVAELWRHDGQTLRFYNLEDGKYRQSDASKAFPFLKPEHLKPFLQMTDAVDETTIMRRFHDWLRGQ